MSLMHLKILPSLSPICACQCVRFNIWGNSVVLVIIEMKKLILIFLCHGRQSFYSPLLWWRFSEAVFFFFRTLKLIEVNNDCCSLYLFWKLTIGSHSHVDTTAYKFIFNCFVVPFFFYGMHAYARNSAIEVDLLLMYHDLL